MIHLEFPKRLPADKFMTPVAGWCVAEAPVASIAVRVAGDLQACRLEERPDVSAAHPGKRCTGFRGTLDFLHAAGLPEIRAGALEIEVISDPGESRRVSVDVAPTWLEDLDRMKAAGSTGAAALGLGLFSGDAHYRAYVGRPEDFDLSSAGAFQLLVLLGLRQYHRVLDIGCGSLRTGRLLIPYLNPGNYVGVEPNRWLVEEGLAHELGRDIVDVKRPTFLYADSPAVLDRAPCANYALANSIFSHAARPQIEGWLRHTAANLCQSGALVATFLDGSEDYMGGEWVYPGCVRYRRATLAVLAAGCGLGFRVLDWRHLHGQTWALFSRPAFDLGRLNGTDLAWNSLMKAQAD